MGDVVAADAATVMDPHLLVGAASGDGQQLALQDLIDANRAAHHLPTSAPTTTGQAWGGL